MNRINNKNNKLIYYFSYTLSFVFIVGMIYFFHHINGKTLIPFDSDGYRQHYRALVYYSNYLKTVFNNIFIKHNFSIPQWGYTIGEGSDILTTFHYYGFGDFLCVFSGLIPENKIHIFYELIPAIKMYMSGIAFSWLCFETGRTNRFAILAGSLLYSVSMESFTALTGHTMFVSATLFLPLIILGFERIVAGKSSLLFTISVLLSSLSNVLFFYMNVLCTVIYVLVRLFYINDSFKYKLGIFEKVAICSVFGVLMSAVIFLPFAYVILNSTRLSSPVLYSQIYSIDTYKEFVTSFVFNASDSYFGNFTYISLIALPAFLLKEKTPVLKTLLAISILFLCIPFLASAFNAFLYPFDRWYYAISLLISYITVFSFEDVDGIKRYVCVGVFVSTVYYAACILLNREEWKIYALIALLTFITLFLIKYVKKEKYVYLLLIASVIFGLSFRTLFKFSSIWWNQTRFAAPYEVFNTHNEEHDIVESLNDNSFYRYSGNDLADNESINSSLSATNYYWSLSNQYVDSFRNDLGMVDTNNHHYINYDGRFSLNALSSVKYYVTSIGDDSDIPYGFKLNKTDDRFDVYQTLYSLPLIYSYDSFVPSELWNKMSLEERNEILLQSVVTDLENEKIKNNINPSFNNNKISYTLENTEGVEINNNIYNALYGNANISLNVDTSLEGEYYIIFEGFEYPDNTWVRITTENGVKKYLTYKGQTSPGYLNRHDYMVYLGYYPEFKDTIKLDFLVEGEYKIDSIRIINQPLDNQLKYYEDRNDNYEIIDYKLSDNVVKIDINSKKTQFICLSMPYSDGWKVYIDGQLSNLYQANIQYMGVILDEGVHEVEFRYETPLLKAGAIVSLCGVIGYLVYIKLVNKLEAK